MLRKAKPMMTMHRRFRTPAAQQQMLPSFDASFWLPNMGVLQSHAYEHPDQGFHSQIDAFSDLDSYESMEYEEGYQGFDIGDWVNKLSAPTETLCDIPCSQAADNAQCTIGPTEVDPLMLAIQSSSAPASNPTQLDSFPNRAKKHVCTYSQCNKPFPRRSQLLIHIRSHNSEKPYLCSVPCCGQQFSQLGNLKDYERRHRGEKPFSCETPGCDKRFSQRSSLRSHRVSVHGVCGSSSSGNTPTDVSRTKVLTPGESKDHHVSNAASTAARPTPNSPLALASHSPSSAIS